MSDNEPAETQGQPLFTVEQRGILLVVLLPLFMSLLSVSLINVILPAIGQALHASESSLQWVLTGYTLSFGIFLIPAGRAGDLFGRARIFIAGASIFALSSLLAGLAPTDLVLIIARICMGLGSGLLGPQVIGLLQQFFDGERRAKAFGMFGAVVGVSVAIGPLLGGVLIGILGVETGWRWSFLINVVFGAISVVCAVRWFPPEAWQPMHTRENAEHYTTGKASRKMPDIDPLGVILMTLGLLGLMFPFLYPSPGLFIWCLTPLGVGMLWVWSRWEKRYKSRGGAPMIDMNLFQIPLAGALYSSVCTLWACRASG